MEKIKLENFVEKSKDFENLGSGFEEEFLDYRLILMVGKIFPHYFPIRQHLILIIII